LYSSLVFNEHFNPQASIGIVTRGASYSVCHEVIESLGLSKQVHLLNIELTYPIHLSDFIQFANNKKKIIIAEDQDGFLETMIKREAFGKVTCEIQGKEFFPAWGELSDGLLRDYFSKEFNVTKPNKALSLKIDCPERAGSFCVGSCSRYFSSGRSGLW